ncbi:MAG: 5-(carboxyamino)imidazole ribonucleotide synthase, partial [Actinomycetota bacterium]|nr:5-(carboxyamino)imidazole ribonucleotide synthase [Actinomycetota bacterium]
DALGELVSLVDVVTYEFENVPVETTLALADRVMVAPAPLALLKAQDRLVEKRYLNDIGVPTAPFLPLTSPADVDRVVDALGGRAIVKTRRFGYDGKGQTRVDGSIGLDAAERLFVDLGCDPDASPDALIAEALVAFDGELSVIGARDRSGLVVCFPPARNVHRDGILATSTVPHGWGPEIEAEAVAHTTRLLHSLEYVGVLGLEFFVLSGVGNHLLANEFAPRVHNSGHWTEAACVVSQFEQHVRAVTGAPVVDPGLHSACEMRNLIGNDVDSLPALLEEPRTLVHLYGKAEVRPGRKMGHATRLS